MTEDQYEQLYAALARRCNAEDLAPIDLAEAAAETKWPLCLDVLRWSANRSATEQADLEAWLASNPGELAREGIFPLFEYFSRMALAADIEVKAEHLREDEITEEEAADTCEQCGALRYLTLTGEVRSNGCPQGGAPEDASETVPVVPENPPNTESHTSFGYVRVVSHRGDGSGTLPDRFMFKGCGTDAAVASLSRRLRMVSVGEYAMIGYSNGAREFEIRFFGPKREGRMLEAHIRVLVEFRG